MAGKSDFTEEEWETMHKGVTRAGLLMSVSDRGFLDSFKEAGASRGTSRKLGATVRARSCASSRRRAGPGSE
jgi:hypothetical protein